MKESDFCTQITDQLKKSGFYRVKMVAGTHGFIGVPDILCCIHGRFVALEVKVLRKGSVRYTDQQLLAMAEIRKAGGLAYGVIVDPTKPPATRFKLDRALAPTAYGSVLELVVQVSEQEALPASQ